MTSLLELWAGLPRWARIVLVLFSWPVAIIIGIAYLINHQSELRSVITGRGVRISHLLWLGIVGSLIVVGALPSHVPDDIATTVFLLCAGGLCSRWLRMRAQRRWRETGGRMTETAKPAGRHARTPLADQVAANSESIAATIQRLEAAETRVNGLSDVLITAMQAGGAAVPETLREVAQPDSRPRLYVVRDDEPAAG